MGNELILGIAKIEDLLLESKLSETEKNKDVIKLRLQVPAYQRPYKWNVERSNQLLDDIEEADMASAYLWQKLSEESVFELDEEELRRADEAAAQKEKELEAQKPVFDTEEERLSFEKEYEEEYGEAFAEIDLSEFTRNMYRMELQLGAMGYEEALKQGKAVTYDDYEKYIESIREYYPNLTMDQMKEQFTVENYAKERYNDIICKELDDYVHSEFKKKMNPYR